MQTPAQAARQRESGGHRLEQPWREAENLKVHFRRGQVALITAAPGAGKSVFANAYAVKAKSTSVLYLAMDTDAFTTSVRLVAMIADAPMHRAEEAVKRREQWALDALNTVQNVRYGFPPQPDEEEITDRLLAYREAEGKFPDMLIVDNLGNIDTGDDDIAGMRKFMRELNVAAMRTGTCILVLHHATGEHENGNEPIPLSGLLGKVSKYPSLILTMHRASHDRLGISVVKNRFGPAKADGNGVIFYLSTNLERAQVEDYEPEGSNRLV